MSLEETDNNECTTNRNYYNYNAIESLMLNIDDYKEIKSIKKVFICGYEVNNEGKFPFLKFLLNKNILNKLEFMQISLYNSDDITSEYLTEQTKKYLYKLLICESDYIEFTEKLLFYGFYIYKGDIYIFVDLTNCKLNINDVYSENTLWFTLINEIINTKRLCNFDIDPFVTKFFSENFDFCVLENDKNEIYETPIVGYVAKPENKLKFTYTFGETKKDKNDILGAFYYFTDFKNSIKRAHGLMSSNAGIVRFALFSGMTKYIENLPTDDIDYSEIKTQRLNDDKLDKIYEQLTARISDHDGLWSKEADCCYLGNIMLDNGTYLKDAPLLALKEYDQQIPLSYHYFNKYAFQNNQYSIA
jgi:hypothetical protein